MDESKIGGLISRNLLPLHHLHKIGGNTNVNIKTLNGVDTKTPNDGITNGKVMIGVVFLLVAGYCFATPTNKITNVKLGNGESADLFSKSLACRHERMSCTRRAVKTEHLVARTLLSVLSCRARLSTFRHAHKCMAHGSSASSD